MTTTTVTYTPWGWAHDIEELAEGVWRVWTPSHGGLKLSRERWDSLPPALRDAMYAQTFAEEDCEEPIVRTLLGLGDDIEREMALKVAGYFDRYAPALPYLRSCSPGIHYHAVAYWGGHGWRQSSAAGRSRSAGRMGAGHDRDDAAQAPQLPSTTTKLQTEFGSLFVTVSVDEDGEPFEVFGFLGKGGSFQHGVTELACRLTSPCTCEGERPSKR